MLENQLRIRVSNQVIKHKNMVTISSFFIDRKLLNDKNYKLTTKSSFCSQEHTVILSLSTVQENNYNACEKNTIKTLLDCKILIQMLITENWQDTQKLTNTDE